MRLIGHIMDLLRGHPQGSEMRACAPGAINYSLFARNPEGVADLSNADAYLAFLAGAQEFAVFTALDEGGIEKFARLGLLNSLCRHRSEGIGPLR